jgi:hypothetical protein
MIVVHSIEVSTLYPPVVISLLAKRLENLLFVIPYTSLGVWPRDHNMPLQRSTTRVCHALLWLLGYIHGTTAPHRVLWFPGVDTRYHGPSCTMWAWAKSQAIFHSSEKDSLPIVFLISKQIVPYQTHGGTCCPGVSTPKIWSLADSSTTCHDGINHLHHSNHCSNHSIDPHTVKSHLDRWETPSLTLRHKPNSTP